MIFRRILDSTQTQQDFKFNVKQIEKKKLQKLQKTEQKFTNN